MNLATHSTPQCVVLSTFASEFDTLYKALYRKDPC